MNHIPTPEQLAHTRARYAEMKRRGWFTPGAQHGLLPEMHADAHAFAHHIHMQGWVSDPEYLQNYGPHPMDPHAIRETPKQNLSPKSSWETLLSPKKSQPVPTPKHSKARPKASDSWHRLVLKQKK